MIRSLRNFLGGLVAAVLLAACQPKPEFDPDLRSYCFNNASRPNVYGVWAGEGTTDWRIVRDETWPTLVFSFERGATDYEVADLGYCFFIDSPSEAGPGGMCADGQLTIGTISENSLTGVYDFTLADGRNKAQSFSAEYCPPEKGVRAAAARAWLRILSWLD